MPISILKISNRNYFYLVAGFSLITILASILLALYTITDNYTSLSYLDKAYGINAKIDRIYTLLKDEENHQKGYLITHKPGFFTTTDYAKKNINLEYDEIFNILYEDKEQQQNLANFKGEIDLKLKLLDEGEEYFKRGAIDSDSLTRIITKGDVISDKLRKTMSKLKKVEYKRFSGLREKTFTKSELSIFIVALTSGISILLLISILIALKREYEAKALMERKLIASEKRLQQQVHMLNVSNKELEQFAYVASHDLEEPLRKISSFSEKIQMKLANYEDEEVLDCLKRLNTSVDRMRMFIRDLLNYSRVTRMLDINETVDINTILKQITEDLELVLTAKKAVVDIKPLIKLKGNNTQLKQLFQNLISNAIKFSDKPIPEIEITGKYFTDEELNLVEWIRDINVKHKKYYCIFVKDNGIGFELQYLRQIFIIFQRLHGRSEFEGTGIGLAICKRIAENHEGFITAESEVGIGTKFIVGLPVN